MNNNLLIMLIAIVWMLLLTFFVFWIFIRLKNLFKETKSKDFLKIFKDIEDIQQKNLKDILNLNIEMDFFKKESRLNFQKIGLVKYNPFNESGGDHSFSLVLLDGNKNGIIITSLHTRERTRLYLKEVKVGKSLIEISKDEEKALKEALK